MTYLRNCVYLVMMVYFSHDTDLNYKLYYYNFVQILVSYVLKTGISSYIKINAICLFHAFGKNILLKKKAKMAKYNFDHNLNFNKYIKK